CGLRRSGPGPGWEIVGRLPQRRLGNSRYSREKGTYLGGSGSRHADLLHAVLTGRSARGVLPPTRRAAYFRNSRGGRGDRRERGRKQVTQHLPRRGQLCLVGGREAVTRRTIWPASKRDRPPVGGYLDRRG